ncbi:acyl-CoA thioesterase [Qipengyuania aurantiaca]|uniref:Acyl-CoA thioesterase n=1 Tax=Qipengyuania aurantiaca TaxID=2867233 RepID=A0ABX8ZV96_9SPHN|nr:acyl-CoA thioesterase [Qipengyuania aurantiaca]QZD91068.1 acyl-CoA thioesterase [Qipengyuania aurantiaca]
MSASFTQDFTAKHEHIDELGHVNNTVWVRWIQDLATAHWADTARPEDAERFFWVVTRHEIDYRGNVSEGETVTGETWIEGEPRGATSIRRVDFRNAAGKVIVSAATTWAMLDRESQRLVRVREDVLAPFRA